MSYSAIVYSRVRENKMAAEKYGCFVKAKTACYSVFTSLKQNKNTKDNCLKVSKFIYSADVS